MISHLRDHKLMLLLEVVKLRKVSEQEIGKMDAPVLGQLMEVLVVMEVQSQTTETK